MKVLSYITLPQVILLVVVCEQILYLDANGFSYIPPLFHNMMTITNIRKDYRSSGSVSSIHPSNISALVLAMCDELERLHKELSKYDSPYKEK